MSELIAPLVAAIGSAIALILFLLAGKVWRNRHVYFNEDDYQTGIAYDRKDNRIIPVRRLKKERH